MAMDRLLKSHKQIPVLCIVSASLQWLLPPALLPLVPIFPLLHPCHTSRTVHAACYAPFWLLLHQLLGTLPEAFRKKTNSVTTLSFVLEVEHGLFSFCHYQPVVLVLLPTECVGCLPAATKIPFTTLFTLLLASPVPTFVGTHGPWEIQP